jgi:hypothetical protein
MSQAPGRKIEAFNAVEFMRIFANKCRRQIGQIGDAPIESQYPQMDKRKTGLNGIPNLDFGLIFSLISGRDLNLSSSADRLS